MNSVTYKIAHIHHQGQDLIIVPLPSRFQMLTDDKKSEVVARLGVCANEAHLRGHVCVVWQYGNKFNFIAPNPWHPFFRNSDMAGIQLNINKKLICYDF